MIYLEAKEEVLLFFTTERCPVCHGLVPVEPVLSPARKPGAGYACPNDCGKFYWNRLANGWIFHDRRLYEGPKERVLQVSTGQCGGCSRIFVLPPPDRDRVIACAGKHAGCYFVHEMLVWTYWCGCGYSTYYQLNPTFEPFDPESKIKPIKAEEPVEWRLWYSCPKSMAQDGQEACLYDL